MLGYQGRSPWLVGRAVLDRQTLHAADLQAETEEYPEGSELARRLGHRTILAVPLIRAGEAIGAIFIRRTEARPFTDRQIKLRSEMIDMIRLMQKKVGTPDVTAEVLYEEFSQKLAEISKR